MGFDNPLFIIKKSKIIPMENLFINIIPITITQ